MLRRLGNFPIQMIPVEDQASTSSLLTDRALYFYFLVGTSTSSLLLPPLRETFLTKMVAATIELDDQLVGRHNDEGLHADAAAAVIHRHPATTSMLEA